MADQLQLRGGTTSEHSTFTGALREVTVDTDKDVLVVHDNATAGGHPLMAEDGSNSALALGSAGTPSLKFTGDPNTGIFSPGADQLAVSTAGTERVEWGTSEVVFNDGGANYDFRIEGDTNANLLFVDASADRIGVGTSSPSTTLDVTGTARVTSFLTLGSWIQGTTQLDLFGDSSSSLGVRLDSSGRLGIGNTSPSSFNNDMNDLVVGSGSGNRGMSIISGSTSTGNILFHDAANTSISGMVRYDHSSNAMSFWTNGATERLRIDSSGRLLVGTSSTDSQRTSKVQIAGNGDLSGWGSSLNLSEFGTSYNPWIALQRSRNSTIGSHTVVNSGDILGGIQFNGSDGNSFESGAWIKAEVDGTPGDGDMPGRLVFSTTADGASTPTERMRIKENGRIFAYANNTSGACLYIQSGQAAGTSQTLILGRHSATNIDSGNNSFVVYTNGNVENTNNSYGGISDIKLKENIVDASSQWDDLKAIQVRNYNFKEGQTHTQIGVVAQEVELVSPGLVTESPDTDAEGNNLGTTTKSVNYSVLYMKAVKALQEAMERIETLEAKVVALEAS